MIHRAFGSLVRIAPAALLAMLAAESAQAQIVGFAQTVQYQIRSYHPAQPCPAGFGVQSFNYAGWGVRTHCVACPAGFIFAPHAGSYACAKCAPGTYATFRDGYQKCAK